MKPKTILVSVGLFCFVTIPMAKSQASAQPAENDEGIVGVWRGRSTCMVRSSPCHDEMNVYRVSAIPAKPGIYSVSANKVVEGKEEVMGTGEWKYDHATHTLVYQFPRGVFRLKIEGDKMAGELKLPDGTLYREIDLKRDK